MVNVSLGKDDSLNKSSKKTSYFINSNVTNYLSEREINERKQQIQLTI